MPLIHAPSLYRPPCRRLRRLAGFLYSQKTYSKVFEPIFAEFDEEYLPALAEGCQGKARMILLRIYWSFWLATVAQLPLSLLRILYELWRNTKR